MMPRCWNGTKSTGNGLVKERGVEKCGLHEIEVLVTVTSNQDAQITSRDEHQS